MVVQLLDDHVAHRRLPRRRPARHAYHEGPPGPVRLGVGRGGVPVGGGGGRERGGAARAARAEAEPAEVGAYRGVHHVLHRLPASLSGDRRRAELAIASGLGGFDTGRRWGLGGGGGGEGRRGVGEDAGTRSM